MKYLLLALVLTGCTKQFNYEVGDCLVQPNYSGVKFFKIENKKNGSHLVRFLNTNELTTIPPIQGWENTEKIDCDIANSALKKETK